MNTILNVLFPPPPPRQPVKKPVVVVSSKAQGRSEAALKIMREAKMAEKREARKQTPTSYFLLKDLSAIPMGGPEPELDCNKYLDFQITKKLLGKGTYGSVYEACKAAECKANKYEYVGKVVELGEDAVPIHRFLVEAVIAKFAGDKGFGAPVANFFVCDQGKRGVILMKRLLTVKSQDVSLATFQTLMQKIDLMHQNGILHCDLFLKNLLKRPDTGELVVNDFGLSLVMTDTVPKSLAASDVAQLIFGMASAPSPSERDKANKYLVGKLKVNSATAKHYDNLLDGKLDGVLVNNMSLEIQTPVYKWYRDHVNDDVALMSGIRMRVNKRGTAAEPLLGGSPYISDCKSYYKIIVNNLADVFIRKVGGVREVESLFVWAQPVFCYDDIDTEVAQLRQRFIRRFGQDE